MHPNPRLRELLARWEQALGETARRPSAEELCQDCPELLPLLRREIARRLREESLAETVADPSIKLAEPSADDAPLPAVPGYELIEEIGRGGMGVVYKARDLKLNRPVALKMIIAGAHASPKARARFEIEALAISRLQHPNVVQIFDFGKHDEQAYFSGEYINGGNLDYLLAEGPVTPREAALLLAPVARALHHAHQQGLVHRDLKPANILLHLPDLPPGSPPETRAQKIVRCVPKLTDFGLAKELTSPARLTRTGVAIGTPSYMAPEQALAQNERIGPATDVYGLGALLYELLHGRPPFDAPSDLEVLQAVVQTPPEFDAHPDEVEWKQIKAICLQCLAKEPEARYPSALALAQDLERFLQDEPISARAPSWRPPRWALLLLVCFALVLATAVAELTWLRSNYPGVMTGVVALILAGAALVRRRRPAPPPASQPTPVRQTRLTPPSPSRPPWKVGVLHSLTGTMSVSETPVHEAVLLAIEAINRTGGVLGRRLEAVVADGRSDPAAFLHEAERLIKRDQVCVVFGCWTSACRRTVRPLFEKYDHLLLYPVQYEGLEASPNIFYLGPAPNQQLLPAVEWCLLRLRKRRFSLVGSDYVFPHAAAAILKPAIRRLGGELVGEEYLPLGGVDVGPVIERIRGSAPDVILNLINGDSNLAFFRALRKAGVTPKSTPTVSFSIAEHELRTLGLADMVGDYAAWSYFQSIHTPENQTFLSQLREKFGPLRVATDPMETAWCAVHLWAQAVAAASTVDPPAVRAALRGRSYRGPGGTVKIDPETQNACKVARIGRVRADGQFDVVWSSDAPLPPQPYPDGRSHAEWESMLEEMTRRWSGQWINPVS